MDRLRLAASAAVATCLLGKVEYNPAFVAPTVAGQHTAAPRSAGAAPPQASVSPCNTAGLVGAAAVGAVALAARRRQQAAPKTQVKADLSGLEPQGPIVAYTQALMDAATQKEEAVKVTKDVMMLRDKFDDESNDEVFTLLANDYSLTELERARETAKMLGPFESTVMPKFIPFLAKKNRLSGLRPICKEYIAQLYFQESIAPVVVTSAQPMTDEQIKSLKEKLAGKTGFANIKLITKVDSSLIAGFTAEWDFVDPEDLGTGAAGLDMSMKSVLEERALDQGIVVQV